MTYDAMKELEADSKRERARKAKRALNRFYDSGASIGDQFDGLLTDLFHLAERDGVNITETLNRAQRVYKGEGGMIDFRVLAIQEMDTAHSALQEERDQLDETGELDYEENELRDKKLRVQQLIAKLEL